MVNMKIDDDKKVPDMAIILQKTPLIQADIKDVFKKYMYMGNGDWKFYEYGYDYDISFVDYIYIQDGLYTINKDKPILKEFPLENIDKMRMEILKAVDSTSPFIIDKNSIEPYCLPFKRGNIEGEPFCATNKMEGLLIKTYQSDLFNNWVSSEWVDGDGGINEVSAVDTSAGSFTIDQLNIASKVYNMLNRIAISGGTYNDYLEVQYDENSRRMYEHPVYIGGKIRELAFQEVISQSATTFEGVPQPLGQLGGKGVVAGKNKGGKITVKCTEPCYIMGIVSLTPYVDYSQGNAWDVNLKTMADLHVPALDEIGYQDLITDQMAWFDTELSRDGIPIFKSAGKIPAWTNYMTAVNRVLGNFAEEREEMFMTLNRRYERGLAGIEDLTTYVDPSKFNHIFADARLDAQNFRANIWVGIEARRKMSAKVMPNL